MEELWEEGEEAVFCAPFVTPDGGHDSDGVARIPIVAETAPTVEAICVEPQRMFLEEMDSQDKNALAARAASFLQKLIPAEQKARVSSVGSVLYLYHL